MKKILFFLFILLTVNSFSLGKKMPSNSKAVIEVVTFTLKPGVTAEEFSLLDKEVEREHVSKQPGFLSRESASGYDREWLVIVHWSSAEDAEASMKTFGASPTTKDFMDKIMLDTMVMKRYYKK